MSTENKKRILIFLLLIWLVIPPFIFYKSGASTYYDLKPRNCKLLDIKSTIGKYNLNYYAKIDCQGFIFTENVSESFTAFANIGQYYTWNLTDDKLHEDNIKDFIHLLFFSWAVINSAVIIIAIVITCIKIFEYLFDWSM